MSADPVAPSLGAHPARDAGGLTHLVAVSLIDPSPTNPRKTFSKEAMAELTQSVGKHGVLQPVLLREKKNPARHVPTRYELIAGERRYRAAKAAGVDHIPALVRDLSDEEVLEIQVIENLQRQDLHPLEEADGYHQLVRHGYETSKIAERVGRSQSYVYDRLKLLNLTKESQRLFRDGVIPAGQAVILARLKPAEQDRALKEDDALFEEQQYIGDLLDEEADARPRKVRTVREFQGWIDKHVRFDVDSPELPQLFPPATTEVLAKADEVAEKVVSITHEYHVLPEAKTSERTYGPQSWKRADGTAGSKTCDRSVTGVIVVGPGRGEAFKVCVDKKGCKTHWASEQRAAAKLSKAVTKSGAKTGEDRWKLEQEKRRQEEAREQAVQARWKKASPTILQALADAVNAMKPIDVGAGTMLGELIIENCESYDVKSRTIDKLVERGTMSDELLRHAAFIIIAKAVAHVWTAPKNVPKLAMKLGVDVKEILDRVAPEILDRVAPEKAKAAPAAAATKGENIRKAAKKKAAKGGIQGDVAKVHEPATGKPAKKKPAKKAKG